MAQFVQVINQHKNSFVFLVKKEGLKKAIIVSLDINKALLFSFGNKLWAIIVGISAIIENAPARFSIKTIGTIVFPYDYLGLTILGLPIIYGIISETRIERKWWSQQNIDKADSKKYAKEIIQDPELYLNVVFGVLASIAMFIFEGAIFQALKIPSPLFVLIANYLLSISNYWIDFDKGYIDYNTKLLSHSHLTSIAFFITGLLLFWIFHYWLSPFLKK